MNIPQDAITVQKTPAGKWDVTINWACPSRDLGDDTIEVSTWAVQGADSVLTISDDAIATDKRSTKAWLNAGTLGQYYQVTNTITTTDGRILTGTFLVQIVQYIYLTQPRVI